MWESSEILDDLVEQAQENDYLLPNGKALRYLGWFWRSIPEHSVAISWNDGYHWINVPKKWGYPRSRIEGDDLNDLINDVSEQMDKRVEQGGILEEDKVEMQEILYGYAGDIHETIYTDEWSGKEFTNYYDLWEWGKRQYDGYEWEDDVTREQGDVVNSSP